MNIITSEPIPDFSLRLPITRADKVIADRFSRQQPNPVKAEQVYRNTLAILVVKNYLEMLGIVTDLERSYSWNPVVRLAADVADLQVVGRGALECRPIQPGAAICSVPYEVWDDRVGYVVVEVTGQATNPTEARILGFTPTVTSTEVAIATLKPLEDLLEHLAPLETQVSTVTTAVNASQRSLVNLSEWFQGTITEGWRSLQYLLNPEVQVFAFRGRSESGVRETDQQYAGVRKGKVLNLGVQLAEQPVILVIEIKPAESDRFQILIQVHPASETLYLPPNLRLVILDGQDETFLEAKAREADNFIQLSFRGSVGEAFGARVSLEDAVITEYFKI